MRFRSPIFYARNLGQPVCLLTVKLHVHNNARDSFFPTSGWIESRAFSRAVPESSNSAYIR